MPRVSSQRRHARFCFSPSWPRLPQWPGQRQGRFRGRRPTGEVWSAQFAAAVPGKDWVLTRILWLCGEESGRNRGGRVDSMRRYIYIHGTGDDQPMGVPRSHGCVRMRNRDIIELFELLPVGTEVEIVE
mgnify:CR=1 FL=1